jgi:hypothetical protein
MYPINSKPRQCIPIRLRVESKVIMVLWGLPTRCSVSMFQIPHAITSYTWRSWLSHCATSRKVAGSIPDGVIGIFHWHSVYGRNMALGLTQPLTELSTSRGGRCAGLTTLPLSRAYCLEIWEPQPPGTLTACPAPYRDCFNLLHVYHATISVTSLGF